ncbi:ATP-binding protein [Halorussus halophilus]|uniref:ATP-binding protein n=1 Tax=Halorussus halophilus TaxID=2650975 RepID=UPI0013013D33|nr:ATP-binding protein [Halorussus halophilus]
MDRSPAPATEDGPGVAPWAVSAVGLLLSGGAVLNLVSDLETTHFLAFPILALFFGLILSGSVVYAGYWLTTSELTPNQEWRTFYWTVGGLATMLGIQGFTIAVRLAEKHQVGEAAFSLLFAADAGAIVGFISGVLVVRLRSETAEVRRTRDAMSFLNRLLRHDILNDLAVIQSHAAILEDHVDEEGEPWLDTLSTQSEDATKLIKSSRTVTETVMDEAELHSVELSPMLASQLDTVEQAFEDAEFDADVPSNLTVTANDALSRAFVNLLSNAVEHNDKDVAQVSLHVEENDETVTVCIADNGPGIPEEEKETLFEPAEDGDHGFGLFLSQTLVSAYDGCLSVTDNEPRGTVFEVELPRHSAN